jgi:tetratricopeptide (TPR) repeat protein
MKCANARELISDYVDGVLGSEREAGLKAHLEGCPDCRELAGDFASIVRGAKGLSALEPSAALWSRIAAGVREARPEAPAAAPERESWLRKSWRPASWAYATAAALLLLVVGAVIFRQVQKPAVRAEKGRSVEYTVAKLQQAQDYYEKAIQALNEAVKSQEGGMDPRLAEVFNRNLAAMDETIQACRQIIRQDPENMTARAYLLTAYREKVNFLEEMMGAERSALRDMKETTL